MKGREIIRNEFGRYSVLFALGVALVCAGCSSASGGPPANATVVSAPPSASTPASASVPAATSAQAENFTIDQHVSVSSEEGYSFDLAFTATPESFLTADIPNSNPGEARVTWSPAVSGSMTVTNTTPGHNLPTPLISVSGFWPISSPVCAAQIYGPPGSGFGVAKDYHFAEPQEDSNGLPGGIHPVGAPEDYCVLNFGRIDEEATRNPVPVGGTKSASWLNGDGKLVVFKSESDYRLVAAALEAGPEVWLVLKTDHGGTVVGYDYAGLAECPVYNELLGAPDRTANAMVWSSAPVTC